METKININAIPDSIPRSENFKTINGQSILGSGNITISGDGSSGGSGAYSEVNHGTSDTTFTLTPNTFHVWDEVASLTLDFGSETSGVANEFLFQFTSGSEATTLSISDDVKWTEKLTIEPNRIYQVSILKGLASVLSWDNINKITFTYNGATYEAESNMTWQHFAISDYNVWNWRVESMGIYTGSGYLSYNGSRVRYDDIIIENGSYYSIQESGGGA